jgi:hypothetical protein
LGTEFIVFAIVLAIVSSAQAEDMGPCADALRKNAVCEPANKYALERMNRDHLEAIIVMQNVQTGALVAFAASDPVKLDVTTALLPLSPVKLIAAASWLDHDRANQSDSGKLLADSIVSGNDNAGRRIASELREAVGTEKALQDLARYGFPARGLGEMEMDNTFWFELAPQWQSKLVPAAAYHSLGQQTTTREWEDTFSIGEERFVTTALHLSRFLQAVGNGGVLIAPTARGNEAKDRLGSTIPATRVMSEATALKLQEVMRGAVDHGTAKSAKPILDRTGWSMGGKTGTGPAPGTNDPGPGSDGCFAGLVFDPQGKARFTVVAYVKHGGFGGGNAARISAELARYLIGAGG